MHGISAWYGVNYGVESGRGRTLFQSILMLLGALPVCRSSRGQKPVSSFAISSTMLRALTAILDDSLSSLPYSSSCRSQHNSCSGLMLGRGQWSQ